MRAKKDEVCNKGREGNKREVKQGGVINLDNKLIGCSIETHYRPSELSP